MIAVDRLKAYGSPRPVSVRLVIELNREASRRGLLTIEEIGGHGGEVPKAVGT